MKIEHKTFDLDLKSVSKAGEFSGYLSVFGNVDAYGEIVVPGAFAESLETWRAKGRMPPVLWQHSGHEPIGVFEEMSEDDKGLSVKGRLLVDDVARAKEAHALLKARAVSGMSIGFETVGEEKGDKGERLLTKIKLWEGSIVTFPANEEAQVEAVKMLLRGGELPDLKTFERFLRESGFSKSQATAIAGRGLSYLLRSESDGLANEEQVSRALADLKSTTL